VGGALCWERRGWRGPPPPSEQHSPRTGCYSVGLLCGERGGGVHVETRREGGGASMSRTGLGRGVMVGLHMLVVY